MKKNKEDYSFLNDDFQNESLGTKTNNLQKFVSCAQGKLIEKLKNKEFCKEHKLSKETQDYDIIKFGSELVDLYDFEVSMHTQHSV